MMYPEPGVGFNEARILKTRKPRNETMPPQRSFQSASMSPAVPTPTNRNKMMLYVLSAGPFLPQLSIATRIATNKIIAASNVPEIRASFRSFLFED